MATRTLGTALLAGFLFVAGLAGLYVSWTAWPRTAGTSPLMALLALAWGLTYIVAGVLTWRRSRFAAVSFAAAMGLLLLPARFLVPGGELVIPAMIVLALVAVIGVWYLRGLRRAAGVTKG
jgi:hypothetical protein